MQGAAYQLIVFMSVFDIIHAIAVTLVDTPRLTDDKERKRDQYPTRTSARIVLVNIQRSHDVAYIAILFEALTSS